LRETVLPRIDGAFLLSKLIEFAAETPCAHSQSRLIRKNLSGGISWFTFSRAQETQEAAIFRLSKAE
jgi:hypothetical protein